jgi:hypothetical protein
VGAAAEKAGIPAVSIVAPQFAGLCKIAVKGEGIPSLAMAFIPQQVMSGASKDAQTSCEAAIEDIINGLTTWVPEKEVEQVEKWLAFEGTDYQDAADTMNSVFLTNRWGDGLPLIPATEERVDWILTGTDLPREKVLIRKLFPRRAPITVENVAIHAAMAGARPEYLPVILAALSLLDTDTENGYRAVHFLQESIGIFAPALVINGPIAEELNINSSYGVMGPGWQANATIGRAVNLLLETAGAYSGLPAGTPRAHSRPGRYTWCLAENEAENPWQPLHIELGKEPGASTVTLLAGRGTQTIMVYPPAEQIVGLIAWAVKGITSKTYASPFAQLLILCPAHAHVIADAGWSKEDIRNYVYENARISVAQADAIGLTVEGKVWRKKLGADEYAMFPQATISDRSIMAPMTDSPDDLMIVVAGGPGSDNSTLIPSATKKLIGDIDKYKPAHWQELVKKAKKELQY